MTRKQRFVVALLALVGVGVIPALLPKGPEAAIDPSALLASGQLLAGVAIVFVGGLLTALTPCVYPLIPITVGIFGARKAESRGRAFLLTSVYVVGMGVVFSVLGVMAAKTGQAFGSLLGDPRVAIGLAIFLLLLASSMFGAFELALPTGIVQRLNSVGGAGLGGAFLMGSVAGLLAAPCTGPVLTALLAFVAKTQSVATGGTLLFIYALGIGVPFLLIGAFALRLPKGGQWMESVKSVLGIALVALAASYLRDAFPFLGSAFSQAGDALGRIPGAWLAALLAAIGVWFGAVHLSFKGGAAEAMLKGTGVVMVAGALLLRIAALNAPLNGEVLARLCESRKLLSALSDAVSVKICMAATRETSQMNWNIRFPAKNGSPLSVIDDALRTASQAKKPVLIDFSAEWCAACKELDRETYVDPRVVAEAKGRFLTIKVDGTNVPDEVQALYDRFGVEGLPTVAFISSDGKVLSAPRITGFIPPDRFLDELRKVR